MTLRLPEVVHDQLREMAFTSRRSHDLRRNMTNNVNSDDLCEYVAIVKWIRVEDRTNAKWKPKAGIYTTTHVRASLDGQPDTITFLEDAFNLNLRERAPSPLIPTDLPYSPLCARGMS